MARKAESDRLEAMADTIEEHPAITQGRLAQMLGLHRSAVTRALPALEDKGVLLVEDDRGRLSLFGRRK
jgi:Mn-dependent DtxR family transcriptional regulator